MATIERLVFVALDGDPPPALGLERLTAYEATGRILQRAFARYAGPAGLSVTLVADLADFVQIRPVDGLSVVYLMGHAWLDNGGFMTAGRKGAQTVLLGGEDVVTALHGCFDGGDAVV